MRSLFLYSVLLAFALPCSAQQCVTFEGLTHCPIGSGMLNISNGFLYAVNAQSGDGVSINLPKTTSWSGQMRFGNTRKHAVVQQEARANGAVISTSEMRINQNGLMFKASFTGQVQSTYSVIIRDAKGVLTGAQGGVTSSSQVVANPGDMDWHPWGQGPIWPSDDYTDPEPDIDEDPEPDIDVDFKRLSSGACSWTLSFGGSMTFNLPNGSSVTGSSIQMVEEVGAGQQYAYLNFDEITVRSDTDSIIISGETFE